MRRLSVGIVLIAFASAAAAGVRENNRWSDAARRDVEAGYRLFRDNHPGWHDKSNPGFRTQLGRARELAFKAASAAKDERGYEDALGAFSAVLSDGHARLVGTDSAPSNSGRWPGFTAAWRGKRLLVADADPASRIPVGAEIAQCDGKPIRSIIVARLASRGMREKEAGQWWSRSPRALVDSSDASGTPPASCTFQVGSRIIRQSLNWSPAPADLAERLKSASDGERTPIGLSEPRPGLFLIGLPDFEPDEAGRAAYGRLFAQLKDKLELLRHARAVIIDLRYNDGGSDEWPLETANALWGEGPVESAMNAAQRHVQIWWRASLGNIAFARELAARLRREGQAGIAEQIDGAAVGMLRARVARRPFAIERNDQRTKDSALAPSSFNTPVYVITPGRCASACLDAVDIFKLFANTHLIGAPTSADSQYLEIRTVPLPSGHGMAIIPTKIWMYRPRKGGQIYEPDVEATQLDWSTGAFLNLIEAHLGNSPLAHKVSAHKSVPPFQTSGAGLSTPDI